MSKAALRALKRDADTLASLAGGAGRGVGRFESLAAEYACVRLRAGDKAGAPLYALLRRLFRLYLGVADDAMVLFTGKLCRSYHKRQHERLFEGESALHSRGEESAIFKHSEDFTRCSVDGFNYEYRKLARSKDAYKYEEVC
jgi:hypothetical protein